MPSSAGTMRTMRLRKVQCDACGAIARVSRAGIQAGAPLCGTSGCEFYGEAMRCADIADAIECGLASLDDLPRIARTEVCHRNGWQDEIVRTSPGRRNPPKQCAEQGCSKFVKRGETRCIDHSGHDMPF